MSLTFSTHLRGQIIKSLQETLVLTIFTHTVYHENYLSLFQKKQLPAPTGNWFKWKQSALENQNNDLKEAKMLCRKC